MLLPDPWFAAMARMQPFQNPALRKVLEHDKNGVNGHNSPGSKESSMAREIAIFADRKARGALMTERNIYNGHT